jgi:hypothetical protein
MPGHKGFINKEIGLTRQQATIATQFIIKNYYKYHLGAKQFDDEKKNLIVKSINKEFKDKLNDNKEYYTVYKVENWISNRIYRDKKILNDIKDETIISHNLEMCDTILQRNTVKIMNEKIQRKLQNKNKLRKDKYHLLPDSNFFSEQPDSQIDDESEIPSSQIDDESEIPDIPYSKYFDESEIPDIPYNKYFDE